jgi:hypothetical protein
VVLSISSHAYNLLLRQSNEPGHDEDKDQIEEKQEEETGEITAATTNQVFESYRTS